MMKVRDQFKCLMKQNITYKKIQKSALTVWHSHLVERYKLRRHHEQML